jgi:DUF1680 family protein
MRATPCYLVLLALLSPTLAVKAAEPPQAWPKIAIADPAQVELGGPLDAALRRGVARLAQAPFTEAWLRADVSFEQERIFTNYSGDASGRFLELASLTSPGGKRLPATLDPILATVPRYQKADGHFGVEVDLTKPLTKGSPPIPMLWGNGRLLVGLVTAAERFDDAKALAAAKRLGDFYVNTAEQLCSPGREAEFRASGTYGDSYTCCYFPAIEGLAMLHRATGEARYLQQARRMAEFFRKFDALPIDHSHANLCDWRAILLLFDLTHDGQYLDRAVAKWEAAMTGGYVWPIGGVGEHWYVAFGIDEGCSESDWLRFNLDLWRLTGNVRYLDVAERLLYNQYPANQTANGGYGARHFDGDAAGPIATGGAVDEWPFCCSFHGPLGLYFLKGYLASGSDRGVFVNFPVDFVAPVHAAGRDWRLVAQSKPEFRQGRTTLSIELAPRDVATAARTTLWVRVPGWADRVEAVTAAGKPIAPAVEGGYLRIERDFRAGEKIAITWTNGLQIEGRCFKKLQLEKAVISRLRDVAIVSGPQVLFATPAVSGRPTLLATVDAAGRLALPGGGANGCASVALPSLDATEVQIAAALQSARPILLRPWGEFPAGRRAAFMSDLVVVPAASLDAKVLAEFARRANEAESLRLGPFFGEKLESRPEVWLGNQGWTFSPQGLRVAGGDIGLIDGEGYADYRFEFDLTLPAQGQGIAGWVVRAKSENDCVMYQLQTGDSPFQAPEFKTRPNTLRPHVRRNGQWTIADPVDLPTKVERGQTHRIAVECRGDRVSVFLDGRKLHEQNVPELRSGAVGFRAAGLAEEGVYRKITLRKLD